MSTPFTTSFTVSKTEQQAFEAIKNVRGWWSETIDGSTAALNDEFVYRYQDLHVSRQRLTEVVEGKKMVWLVVDARLNFTTNKTEWTGTEVVFEVSKKGPSTEVRFTHRGLVPELECYDGCSSAWASYVGRSLKQLIEAGQGEPDRA